MRSLISGGKDAAAQRAPQSQSVRTMLTRGPPDLRLLQHRCLYLHFLTAKLARTKHSLYVASGI